MFRTPIRGDSMRGVNSRDSSGAPHLVTQAMMFPTPNAQEFAGLNQSGDGRKKPNKLAWAVSLYPTPTVHGDYNRAGASENSGNGLATVAGGSLNPDWVEWLMGFPPGWTNLSGGELNRTSPEPPAASLTA
jgi:hypothetical protein